MTSVSRILFDTQKTYYFATGARRSYEWARRQLNRMGRNDQGERGRPPAAVCAISRTATHEYSSNTGLLLET